MTEGDIVGMLCKISMPSEAQSEFIRDGVVFLSLGVTFGAACRATWTQIGIGLIVGGVVSTLYLFHVNRALGALHEESRILSPKRWTEEEIRECYQKIQHEQPDISKALPPKQDRRYIVVGGSGIEWFS